MTPPNHAQNPNLTPDLDLLSEDKYCKICVPLRKAAIEGNWKAADKILEDNSLTRSCILRKAITRSHATLLHVAAGARQTTFVRDIINLMTEDDQRLLLPDRKGNSAFCFAAAAGEVQIARLMHDRNQHLATVAGCEGKTPLYMAVMFGRNAMARYLYDLTQPTMEYDDQLKNLFFCSITTGLYGFALQLLTDFRELAVARDVNDNRNENENPLPDAGDLNDNENENSLPEAHDMNDNESENLPPEVHTQNDNDNENENPLPEVHDVNDNDNENLMLEARDMNENENENLNSRLLANDVNEIDNEMPPQALDVDDESYETALHMLARMSMTAEALKLVEFLWEKVSRQQYEKVVDLITQPRNLLFAAAEVGNSEFLAVIVRSYPDLIHILDENKLSIFHIAISRRHINVFKLLYEMGFDKELLASYVGIKDGNNMLHLTAKYPDLPPTSIVPGAALEFQQELLLFEEIKVIMQPSLVDKKNKINRLMDHSSTSTVSHSGISIEDSIERYTPKELFTITHKDLKERGEQWMKTTAKSCMLVATLIATVVFAAAFSVPGGNDQQKGIPIRLHNNFFKVFVASDAIALFSSSISILIFLSILTSRYEENDFRTSLPLKLMSGILTLFISVIAMTLAFSSAFFLFYSKSWNLITGPTFVLIFVAAIVYLVLHSSLLKDIICSTFYCRSQIRPKYLPV